MYSVPAGWRGKRWLETFSLTQTRTESWWKTDAVNGRMKRKFEDHLDVFCQSRLYFHFSSRSLPSFLFLLFDFCDSSYVLSLSSSLASLPHTQTHFPVIYHWLKERLGPQNSSLNLIHLSVLTKAKIYFSLSFLCLHEVIIIQRYTLNYDEFSLVLVAVCASPSPPLIGFLEFPPTVIISNQPSAVSSQRAAAPAFPTNHHPGWWCQDETSKQNVARGEKKKKKSTI